MQNPHGLGLEGAVVAAHSAGVFHGARGGFGFVPPSPSAPPHVPNLLLISDAPVVVRDAHRSSCHPAVPSPISSPCFHPSVCVPISDAHSLHLPGLSNLPVPDV